MVGSPKKAKELGKRVTRCPSPISDSDQDSVGEGAMVGQQNFDDVLDTKAKRMKNSGQRTRGLVR